jgi:hypothetical protein
MLKKLTNKQIERLNDYCILSDMLVFPTPGKLEFEVMIVLGMYDPSDIIIINHGRKINILDYLNETEHHYQRYKNDIKAIKKQIKNKI